MTLQIVYFTVEASVVEQNGLTMTTEDNLCSLEGKGMMEDLQCLFIGICTLIKDKLRLKTIFEGRQHSIKMIIDKS